MSAPNLDPSALALALRHLTLASAALSSAKGSDLAVQKIISDLSISSETLKALAKDPGESSDTNGAPDYSPTQLTTEILTELREKLDNWWKNEGLGWASEVKFYPNACEMELSCTLDWDIPDRFSREGQGERESYAQWHAHLESLGIRLHHAPSDYETWVVDCDSSREALIAIIKKALPSAVIRRIHNHRYDNLGRRLHKVTLFARNLAEITALPSPPVKT